MKKEEKSKEVDPNEEFIELIHRINETERKGNREKIPALLETARQLHFEVLNHFHDKRLKDRVPTALQNQSLLLKAISSRLSDPKEKHLEFFFNQIVFPETKRPVKKNRELEVGFTQVDRTQIFNPAQGTFETRKIAPIQGGPKTTPFAKGTPFTLALKPALTQTFTYPYSVLAIADLRYGILKDGATFDRNMATNLGSRILGNKGWLKVKATPKKYLASKLADIRDAQKQNISAGRMSPQNELGPKLSLAGWVGFCAVAKTPIRHDHKGRPIEYKYIETTIDERLNALYVNYVFRQVVYRRKEYKKLLGLLQQFPTYILKPDPSFPNPLKKYHIPEQIRDLETALAQAPDTIGHQFAQKLRIEVTELEVYAPAIKMFLLIRDFQTGKKDLESTVFDKENIMAVFHGGFPIEKFLSEQRAIIFGPEFGQYAIQVCFDQEILPTIKYILEDSKLVLSEQQCQHPKLLKFAIKHNRTDLVSKIMIQNPQSVVAAIDSALDGNDIEAIQSLAEVKEIKFSRRQLEHQNLLSTALKKLSVDIIYRIADVSPDIISNELKNNNRTLMELLFQQEKPMIPSELLRYKNLLKYAVKNHQRNFIFHILKSKAPQTEDEVLQVTASILAEHNYIPKPGDPSLIKILNFIYSQKFHSQFRKFVNNFCENYVGNNHGFLEEFVPDDHQQGLFSLTIENNDLDNLETMLRFLADKGLDKRQVACMVARLADSKLQEKNKHLMSDVLRTHSEDINDQRFIEDVIIELEEMKCDLSIRISLVTQLHDPYDERYLQRPQAVQLILGIIKRAPNISTVMRIVNILEKTGDSRWNFIKERRSYVRSGTYSYTCHGQPVSKSWIEIMARAQDKMIELAQRSPLNDADVIAFLKKPTWETGFISSIFTTPPNKAEQYQVLLHGNKIPEDKSTVPRQ